MQAVPKFQSVVEAIAGCYGIDLASAGAYLRLAQPEHGYLAIETYGRGDHTTRIRVANYIQVGNHWMVDPAIVLHVSCDSTAEDEAPTNMQWIPVEVDRIFHGWSLAGEPDLAGTTVIYDLDQQAEMAKLVEATITHMLERQNWLNAGALATGPAGERTPTDKQESDTTLPDWDDVPF